MRRLVRWAAALTAAVLAIVVGTVGWLGWSSLPKLYVELTRLVGQGRLAEVVGTDALPIDRFMRMLGLARAAESSLGHLDAGARRLLEAYAEGVNGFLALGTTLPPEFLILRHRPEPWRAADSVLFL